MGQQPRRTEIDYGKKLHDRQRWQTALYAPASPLPTSGRWAKSTFAGMKKKRLFTVIAPWNCVFLRAIRPFDLLQSTIIDVATIVSDGRREGADMDNLRLRLKNEVNDCKIKKGKGAVKELREWCNDFRH